MREEEEEEEEIYFRNLRSRPTDISCQLLELMTVAKSFRRLYFHQNQY